MKIAIIGASGFTGRPVLDTLLARGHRPTAIVRRDGALAPEIDQRLADVGDRTDLAAALVGSDAVVSAFHPGWDIPDLYESYLSGSRTIQQAARDAGVGRLLVIGGALSLYGDDGRQLIESVAVPERVAPAIRAARDYQSEIRDEPDLDWTYLSPPPGFGRSGPSERRGRYRTGLESPVVADDGTSSISPADLATAVVDELETPRHHRRRFTVGY